MKGVIDDFSRGRMVDTGGKQLKYDAVQGGVDRPMLG